MLINLLLTLQRLSVFRKIGGVAPCYFAVEDNIQLLAAGSELRSCNGGYRNRSGSGECRYVGNALVS
jgi:hypothetical protein